MKVKTIKNLFFSAAAIMLLNSSCALPLAMMGLYGTAFESAKIERPSPDWHEERAVKPASFIDISLEGKEEYDYPYVYAGEYNLIRVQVTAGETVENISLETTAGTIERTAEDPALYRLYVKEPGIAVEITAVDKITGISGLLVVETINFPLPQPCLNLEENGQMNAETFKKQGQLMLRSDDKLPGLCLCSGFILTRIGADGKKESVKNDKDAFSESVKVLTAKAQKGDIYIFDEIAVNCPGFAEAKKTRSLVYVMSME